MALDKGKWQIILIAAGFLAYAIWRFNVETNIYHPIALLVEIIVNGTIVGFPLLLLSRKTKIKTFMDYVIFLGFIFYLFALDQIVAELPIETFVFNFYQGYYTGNFHILFNKINLVPFRTIWDNLNNPLHIRAYYIQFAGNVILLIPLTFDLLSLKVVQSAKKAILISFCLSIVFEVMQFLLSFIETGFKYYEGRSTDIDDVILNTLGAIIGAALYYGYSFIKEKMIVNNKEKGSTIVNRP